MRFYECGEMCNLVMEETLGHYCTLGFSRPAVLNWRTGWQSTLISMFCFDTHFDTSAQTV